jgi:hypothetical protein
MSEGKTHSVTLEIRNFSILVAASLQEVETEHEAPDDLLDIRTQVVAALENCLQTETLWNDSKYRLGEVLYRYRVALPHGAWLPVVEVIAKATHYTSRTVCEIVADYVRAASVPAEVITELEKEDIDPAAKRHQKVVKMAEQFNADGQSAADAVKAAKIARAKAATAAKIARFEAVWKLNRQFTQDERWTVRSFESQVKGVAKVPPDRKADILANGTAVALWHCGCRKPVIIVPRETIDLAERKEPEAVAADNEGQATG